MRRSAGRLRRGSRCRPATCPAPTASGLIARVTEFVANEGLSLSKLETKTEGAPHGGTQLFSLSGVMLSKDRGGSVSESAAARARSMPSTRRRVDGVAAWVSRRSSRRWRGGACSGLSPLVASMGRGSLADLGTTHRSPSTRVNEAKLARGFKDLELEMGVNIDMCVYDDAEAVKMAAR